MTAPSASDGRSTSPETTFVSKRKRAAARLREPEINAGEISGGHGAPCERAAGLGFPHLPLGIEKVDRGEAGDAIAVEGERALPKSLAAAPAVLRALPKDAQAAAEVGRSIGTNGMSDLRAVEDVDALDRRGADDLGRKPHGDRARADDVSHQRIANQGFPGFLCAGELRVLGKGGYGLRERAVQIEIKPRAGGAVMASAPQRLEQCIACELGHQVAGEATDRAEGRGAGPGGAGPSLVIVAVANDPDTIALLERIVEEPLEGAPGGMHFDGALEMAVMGECDIGIASADMGDDDGVLVLERAEQLVGGIDRRGRGLPLDQNVRRAADRTAFAAEEDVAVAAHAGIARPLVTGQADETAGDIELRREPVELLPEGIGDLKIVSLVADDVDEGEVAGVAEVAFRRAHADGLSTLAVQIAPIAPQRRGGDNAQRICAGNLLAVGNERSSRSPAASTIRFSRTRGPSPDLIAMLCGKPRTGCEDASARVPSASVVGFPHMSSAMMARRNGSPASASEGQIAFQLAAGPGTSAKPGCCGSSVNS